MEAENLIPLVFDANSDAGELRRLVNVIDDYKQLLDGVRAKHLAREGFKEKIVKRKAGPSVSGAALCRNDILAVLRR